MANGRSKSDYPDVEFTPVERQELRRILEADRSLRWVVLAARNFALWVAAIAGLVALYYQGWGKR